MNEGRKEGRRRRNEGDEGMKEGRRRRRKEGEESMNEGMKEGVKEGEKHNSRIIKSLKKIKKNVVYFANIYGFIFMPLHI